MKKLRLSTRIILVTLIRLLINTGRRFVYPFAPALSRELDVPLTAITSIIAASQFTSLVGALGGPLADRFGNRLMMRTGLAMLAIGMLICGLVPLYWPVFIGLVIASFGKTIFDPAIQSFVGHHVPFERRGRVVGFIETAWAGSTLIGIPALALIIAHAGLQASFYLFALLGAVSWFGIGRIIEPDAVKTGGSRKTGRLSAVLKELFRRKSVVGMLAFGFWISIANDCLFVVYGAWFEQEFLVSIVTLGFSTVAIGSAELIGESITALFADRFGLKRTILLGLGLAIVSYLVLPIIGRSLPLAMAGLFCIFLAFELTIVTSFSLTTELAPEARATTMAGFYATAGIGRMAGVVIGGALWQAGGIGLVCASSAVLTAFGMLSLLWGLHGWRPALRSS
jgi:predicted MFS family arabinose efflux permease